MESSLTIVTEDNVPREFIVPVAIGDLDVASMSLPPKAKVGAL